MLLALLAIHRFKRLQFQSKQDGILVKEEQENRHLCVQGKARIKLVHGNQLMGDEWKMATQVMAVSRANVAARNTAESAGTRSTNAIAAAKLDIYKACAER